MTDSFSAPPQRHAFAALLFDMDGTLVDSTDAVVRHWRMMGKELGVDGDEILKTSHGRRSIDVIRDYDAQKANWEYVNEVESRIPTLYGSTARALPGTALLTTLTAHAVPWAIVTSGTSSLVRGWLARLSLTPPRVLVTAEDVPLGKPDPACYALGRQRLGLSEQTRCLVLEDAPAGVRAGVASGGRVCAVATTHGVAELRAAGAEWVVRDLGSLRFVGGGREGVEIEILDAFVS